jgi:hypothetical protein
MQTLAEQSLAHDRPDRNEKDAQKQPRKVLLPPFAGPACTRGTGRKSGSGSGAESTTFAKHSRGLVGARHSGSLRRGVLRSSIAPGG